MRKEKSRIRSRRRRHPSRRFRILEIFRVVSRQVQDGNGAANPQRVAAKEIGTIQTLVKACTMIWALRIMIRIGTIVSRVNQENGDGIRTEGWCTKNE